MENSTKDLLANLALGKKTTYTKIYTPTLLQRVPRSLNRDKLNINVPFVGFDYWNLYEVSFLNNKGKPIVAIGHLIVDCNSPYIVESKSLKLYLNSFNQTKFEDLAQVITTIEKDLSELLEVNVKAVLHNLDTIQNENHISLPNGICLDNLDVDITEYNVDPSLIQQENNSPIIEETIYSNLLKSNCLITSQPDWGTITIKYKGKKLNHEALLKYIVSLRDHNEFHEHCVERIFTDIENNAKIDKLLVMANYTRRGGIDINPIRASCPESLNNFVISRMVRQ